MAKIIMVVPSEDVKLEVQELISEHHTNHLQANVNIDYTPVIVQVVNAHCLDAKRLEADVIIARGILAAEITRLLPDTPVVEVPVTTGDILQAINGLDSKKDTGPIAVIGLGPVQHQLKLVSEQCNKQFSMSDCLHGLATKEQIKELFNLAVSRGCKQFLGGAFVTQLADRAGYNYSFVNSSSESVLIALTQAQHIAATMRKEREKTERYNELLNHSNEGIITLDAEFRVIQINNSAATMLHLDGSSVIGQAIGLFIDDKLLLEALSKKENTSNLLVKSLSGKLVLNVITASLYQEPIGAIVTINKLTNMQSAEINIRQKLHNNRFKANYVFDDLIGHSSIFEETISRARTFAMAPSSVLILGESGTGKELIAQSIHNASERRDAPFVAVNCAAIPESLIESELFGYKNGAFTGASRNGKAGLFEIAHKGTIFLDEVSEIPIHLQSKLLRVVQEGEVMRLGHDRITPVDVRIICAANRDLRPMIDNKKFRADLYYRLAVLQLCVPRLSLRGNDIILLFRHFIQHFSEQIGICPPELLLSGERALLEYTWDGNVRELSNVCEQIVVLNNAELIDERVINDLLYGQGINHQNIPTHSQGGYGHAGNLSSAQLLEREHIIEVLARNQFRRGETARVLRLYRTTLWRKMKVLQIAST